MYLIIFDKTGKGLSGWHYKKLREFEPDWIQKSTIKLDNRKAAKKFARMLSEFGVEKIRIFRATEIIGAFEDYERS